VNLLLDTHIWLWLLEEPNRIALGAYKQIESATELVLSAASVWELAIKTQLGRLNTNLAVAELRQEILQEMAAKELVVTAAHALTAASLPLVHKDPFDRMLVAQASIEGLTLVTADALMRRYGGAQIWAGNG